jgi:hypothetical protein
LYRAGERAYFWTQVVTKAYPILFLEPENKKRKCPAHVEEDKRQESETVHFPFVTEIFRTIRIQRILILYKGNFEREKEGFFPLGRLYQRILFFARINTRQIKDSFFHQDWVMCFFCYFTFHIISHICL